MSDNVHPENRMMHSCTAKPGIWFTYINSWPVKKTLVINELLSDNKDI